MSRPAIPDTPDAPHALAGWITAGPPPALADAAFRSGAALAHLHLAATRPGVPQALWRARLALVAAETCAAIAGRPETAAALRDAVHLTRPGDHPGPGGTIALAWERAVARPVLAAHLGAVLDGMDPDQIARCLDTPGGNPVARAAGALLAVLADMPHGGTQALILADAVLSRGIGAAHVLPCLSLALKPRDLTRRGEDLHLACHRAVVAGVAQALPLAADLARRAARLHEVAPRLRARASARAVDLFLTRDALAPAALVPLMSDRAARRLCDRLVALGALRELTGRPSFRLYGL